MSTKSSNWAAIAHEELDVALRRAFNPAVAREDLLTTDTVSYGVDLESPAPGRQMLILLRAFLHDVESICPAAAASIGGHLDYLEEFTKSKEDEALLLAYFLDYLPLLGKWFDKVVSTSDPDIPFPDGQDALLQKLGFGSFAMGSRWSTQLIDAFFPEHGSFLVALRHYIPCADMDVNRLFMIRQLLFMFKKYVEPCSQEDVREEVARFLGDRNPVALSQIIRDIDKHPGFYRNIS